LFVVSKNEAGVLTKVFECRTGEDKII